MAPRAYWKGFLKLSLVSCPIALYPATTSREKVSFHQINKRTGNRIRYRKVDAETGKEVDPAELAMGYQVGKDKYIVFDHDELEAVAIESKHTIEIDQFVDKGSIDELYLADPYYIVPDGEIGAQAFAVIREVIRGEGMVALGKVVLTSREHVIALEARGRGMLGITLRYPYEIRKEEDYFRDIADEKVPKDMLDLAAHIVETKKARFQPGKFDDRYEDALRALVRRKQKGEKIEQPEEPAPSNVINLMDALRKSLKAQGGASERRPTAGRTRPPTARKRSGPRRRKAG